VTARGYLSGRTEETWLVSFVAETAGKEAVEALGVYQG
jgi:hypothetical protein